MDAVRAVQVAQWGNVDFHDQGPGTDDFFLQRKLSERNKSIRQLSSRSVFREPFMPSPDVVEHHQKVAAVPILREAPHKRLETITWDGERRQDSLRAAPSLS